MNKVLTTATVEARKEQTRDEVLLNRELLFTLDEKNLYIKEHDENKLVLIGGTGKQNLITAGDNIEIIKTEDEEGNPIAPEEIRLLDDIVINTCTLHPESENIYDWKGTVKLGELKDNNTVFLFTKHTELTDLVNAGMLGGEILLKLTDDENGIHHAHYAITLSSTGSWSLKGAVQANSDVRMVRAKWNNEWYYGIKIPEITTIKTIEHTETYYETEIRLVETSYTDDYYLGMATVNGVRQLTNRNTMTISNNSTGTAVSLANTGLTSSGQSNYNKWHYCSVRELMDLRGGDLTDATPELKAAYENNCYLYLNIFWRYYYNNNNPYISIRIIDAYICNRNGNFVPSANTDYIVNHIGIEDSSWLDWNSELAINPSTGNYGQFNAANNYVLKLGDLKFTTITEKEVRVEKTRTYTTQETVTSPFKAAEVWFNGWQKLPTQPSGYLDTELSYVVLSDKSNDNDSFAENFYCDANATISKIPELQDTGEDNAPYRFTISGTLSRTQLIAIADLCKNPNKQIYLDLSEATVDSTAQVWDDYIFKSCVSLRGLIIPKGVTAISECCFLWCTYLRYLDFTPSAGTLLSVGADSGWSTSVGLFTSTRVRNLLIPASVNRIGKYLIGSSNLRNLVFLHQSQNPISVEQWSFMIIGTDANTDASLPSNFHVYMTESWYNGYIKNVYGNNGSLAWQWNNSGGWWTNTLVNSIVTYNPDWDQGSWQTFADTYLWTEDMVNTVRAEFGYTDPIEIDESNIVY